MVRAHCFQAKELVVFPVITKVLLNALNKLARNRVIGREASQLLDPLVQIAGVVDVTHFLLVVTDDFDETAHDVGEEGHAAKHDDHCEDALLIADREVVTVADGAQGREREVAAYEQLVHFVVVHFAEVVVLDEVVFLVLFSLGLLCVAVVPPEAPDKVSDDEGDKD